MPNRDSASKPSPSPGEPVRNDIRNDRTCALCGEPVARGEVVQAIAPEEGMSRSGVSHLRCFHERAMVDRAMRAAERH